MSLRCVSNANSPSPFYLISGSNGILGALVIGIGIVFFYTVYCRFSHPRITQKKLVLAPPPVPQRVLCVLRIYRKAISWAFNCHIAAILKIKDRRGNSLDRRSFTLFDQKDYVDIVSFLPENNPVNVSLEATVTEQGASSFVKRSLTPFSVTNEASLYKIFYYEVVSSKLPKVPLSEDQKLELDIPSTRLFQKITISAWNRMTSSEVTCPDSLWIDNVSQYYKVIQLEFRTIDQQFSLFFGVDPDKAVELPLDQLSKDLQNLSGKTFFAISDVFPACFIKSSSYQSSGHKV